MASLFLRPCNFIAGAATIDSLPEMTHPEIAFIGRSNVGKSSLVNALTGQKALARTSQNPGATKQLNFFLLEDKLMLVDMPGYGFANVGGKQKTDWDKLIKSYLLGRANLKRACVLIDSRRGLMKVDTDFMGILDDSAVSYQIVLTKTDALTAKDLGVLLQTVTKTIQKHPAAHPGIMYTSAMNKDGIEEMRSELESLL